MKLNLDFVLIISWRVTKVLILVTKSVGTYNLFYFFVLSFLLGKSLMQTIMIIQQNITEFIIENESIQTMVA